MENTKVTNTINEINQFIKTKMNVLLQDLIIETNEYEETKRHILELPFVKKIIQEKICENIAATHIITQECVESVSDLNTVSDIDIVTNDTSLSEVNIVLTIHEEPVEETELDLESDEDTQEEEQIVEEEDEEEKENDDAIVEDNVADVEQEELQDDEEVVEEEEEELEDALDEQEDEVVEPQEEEEEEFVIEKKETLDEEGEEFVIEKKETLDEGGEEEEEEVFEIEIDDVIYFTTNEKSGIIYASDENGDPGDEVGVFKNGEPVFL